jgi:hypothetical protein
MSPELEEKTFLDGDLRHAAGPRGWSGKFLTEFSFRLELMPNVFHMNIHLQTGHYVR